MKTILLALFGFVLTLNAQPQLHVVLGDEGYPELPGLTNAAPMGSDSRGLSIISYGSGRALRFNAEVLNIGDRPWVPDPTNTIYWILWGSVSGGVRDFFKFSLFDTNGMVWVEKVEDARWLIWDEVAVIPGIPRRYGWSAPGISPGRAAIPAAQELSGMTLPLLGIPNGHYRLRIEVPGDVAVIPVRIQFWEVRIE